MPGRANNLGPLRARIGGVMSQEFGHFLRRHDGVGHAGVARSPRHAIELRAVRILNQHQATRVMHVANSARPVAATAGQNHRHRARSAVLRERAKEDVDR